MSRLEIKVDGADVEAAKMLKVAGLTLKLLVSIEKEICKAKGEKPGVRWFVDMQSGFSYGLIAIRGEPPKGAAGHYAETLVTVFERMGAQRAVKGIAKE